MGDKIQKEVNVNKLISNDKMDFNVNKLTNKKGQITMFILIGFVIMIIFALLYYLQGLRTDIKTQNYVQKMTSDILKSEGIQSYVSSCLDDALIEGLLLIGKQGGYVYTDQNGTILNTNPASIEYGLDRVAYWTSRFNTKIPPKYPCQNPAIDCKFSNAFGRRDVQFGLSVKTDLWKGGYRPVPSIQSQLESFIANRSKECTDFSSLINVPEFSGYNITEEYPSVEIVFSDNEVTAVLTYPVIVRPYNQEPIKHLLKFYSKVPVRFSKIHAAVFDIVDRDNTDLNYMVVENTSRGVYPTSASTEPYLRFHYLLPYATIREETMENGDSVFIINDSISSIGRQQYYVFQFARQNRPPVLDYIPEQIINVSGESYEYRMNVTATDPDETMISFSTSGWMPSGLDFSDRLPYFSGWSSVLKFTGWWQDIGPHNVTVTVSDSLFNDWQEVNIWVCNQSNHIGRINPEKCIEKCGADYYCDEQEQYKLLGSCHINSYLEDICDSSCSLFSNQTCISRAGCLADLNCDGLTPFSVLPDKSGWCHGQSGCAQFCNKPIVNKFGPLYPITTDTICGCGGDTDGTQCDIDFDFVADGICIGIECVQST